VTSDYPDEALLRFLWTVNELLANTVVPDDLRWRMEKLRKQLAYEHGRAEKDGLLRAVWDSVGVGGYIDAEDNIRGQPAQQDETPRSDWENEAIWRKHGAPPSGLLRRAIIKIGNA
jgi:hypothetical protein